MSKPSPDFWWDFSAPNQSPIIVQSDYAGGERLAEFHFQDAHGRTGSAEIAIGMAQGLIQEFKTGRQTPAWGTTQIKRLIAVGSYMQQPAHFLCDLNCKKAWGMQERPRESFNELDYDDYALLADHELGEAPQHVGTREGGDTKPRDMYFGKVPLLNKWCARQCERQSGPVMRPTQMVLKRFDTRDYNDPSKHQGAST